MDFVEDHFLCGKCQNRNFKRIYSFSIRFHGVNFSDDLIYEKRTEETYQCTECARTYTNEQIREKLEELKAARRQSS